MDRLMECADSSGMLSASAVAIALAKGRSITEIEYLGSIFESIGQNLSTIAAQMACRQEACKQNPQDREDYLPSR